jgi:hypothetical protein
MKYFINLISILFIILFIGCCVYGVILAFYASIVLGIITVIVEPLPLLFGLMGLVNHDICNAIAKIIGL